MSISPYDTDVAADDIEAPLTEVHSRDAPANRRPSLPFLPVLLFASRSFGARRKGASWTSHPVLILAYGQYSPAYVRLNLRCVVPTLVVDGKATTDAFNICRVANERFGGPSLIPEDPQEKACMETYSRFHRSIFVEALSHGDVPDFTRPCYMKRFAGKNHANKALILRQLIKKHRDNAFLKEAYKKKLNILEFTEPRARFALQNRCRRSWRQSTAAWISLKRSWREGPLAMVAGSATGTSLRPISSRARCCAAFTCFALNRKSWQRDHVAPGTKPSSSHGPRSYAE